MTVKSQQTACTQCSARGHAQALAKHTRNHHRHEATGQGHTDGLWQGLALVAVTHQEA